MDINLQNLQTKVPISKSRVLAAAKQALRKLEKRGHFKVFPFLLSIVFVGTVRMRSINKKYLKHDYVTDVLSFDLGQAGGEIIICPQVAQANAKIYHTSTEKEIILYVVHGILHLAGYDDQDPLKKLQMQRMENKLLGGEKNS